MRKVCDEGLFEQRPGWIVGMNQVFVPSLAHLAFLYYEHTEKWGSWYFNHCLESRVRTLFPGQSEAGLERLTLPSLSASGWGFIFEFSACPQPHLILINLFIYTRYSMAPNGTSCLPAFHPFSRSWKRRAIWLYVPSILSLLGLCCVGWQVLIILWHSHQGWAKITNLLLKGC